jgi:hypothetical protein
MKNMMTRLPVAATLSFDGYPPSSIWMIGETNTSINVGI